MFKRFLILVLFCLSACGTPKAVDPFLGKGSDTPTVLTESTDSASKETTKAKEAAKTIDKSAETIKEKAETVEKTAQDENIRGIATDIRHEADSISENISTVGNSLDNIAIAIKKIQKATSSVADLKKALDAEKQKNDATREESMKNLYRWIVFFWIAGFGLMVAGGIAIIWVKKLGGALLGMGLLIVAFASAANYYFQQIAVVGLVVVIAGILMTLGILAYTIIENNRRERANLENVKVMEAAKKILPDDKKIEIFGDKGIASQIQSAPTKKLVSQIREKLKGKTDEGI